MNTSHLQRARFWLATLCAVVALLARGAEKNIVLVVADDMSFTLGCYGDTTAVTPHMDRLSKDSVLFRQAFCTTASCSASRSVLLSGLHNHRNGHYGHLHDYHKFSSHPWVQTLPVMLGRLGYRTARIGKHHNGPEEVFLFDTKLPGSGRNPVEMASQCEAFIKAADAKPFFLYYATTDPHRGGGFATELPHAPDRFGNRPDKAAHPGVHEVFYDAAKLPVPAFLPDTPETRAELAQYYQSVSRVDQGVGRLVEILKQSGKWENTLLIVTSDHGMAFAGAKTTVYEPGLRVPFLLRNPYANGKARSGASEAMISLVDVTPTLLDFAGGFDTAQRAAKPAAAVMQAAKKTGAPQPYLFHGRSILPIVGAANPQGWDAIFGSHTFHEIQMYYPMRVVRDRQYKLIWNIAHPLPFPFASDLWAAPSWQAQWKKGLDAPYGKKTVREYLYRPQFELYDIAADPQETKNLAGNPKLASVLATYKTRLKQFQQDTQDPWILKWDYE